MGQVSGNFGLTGGVASGKTTIARLFEALQHRDNRLEIRRRQFFQRFIQD